MAPGSGLRRRPPFHTLLSGQSRFCSIVVNYFSITQCGVFNNASHALWYVTTGKAQWTQLALIVGKHSSLRPRMDAINA